MRNRKTKGFSWKTWVDPRMADGITKHIDTLAIVGFRVFRPHFSHTTPEKDTAP